MLFKVNTFQLTLKQGEISEVQIESKHNQKL